ncbi:MAG: hypothetical protein ACRDL2_07785 [Gaiellaceae bacterium]
MDSGLEYRPGEPVLVRVVRRERRTLVTDDAAAARGRVPEDVARRIERELVVNVARSGAVFLPVVAAGPRLDEITHRIANASLALYQELLDLEE